MSFAVDANVLLYASDTQSPHQEGARRFLERCAAGPEVCCFAWLTVMSYLRISTHPGIFMHPLTPAKAQENLDRLVRLPHIRVLSEQSGFWDAYQTVTRGIVCRGNLVPDAHLASILFQHGIRRLFTTDTDFRKFETIDSHSPFS